ncbi:histidine phosphatase family protein [Subsaximicrobium wynnwilliamsii]|uniref:Histidine phosphatase family protein n=1 Tax=Subsaximicrobium wynnwilliamsii TaxID=291179 RepID=A0A5C6ZKK6_9FLAO|nr:histidine phosphatase family protein [Subsaximicrobium wynnwilliamsii]TXD84738.1 histidine phosphatase family protein [Subsaximicrobium wynnwilliamsii]TXD90409.1 histidine phosphatase family protein [Subsaximicrobium wynnwilliamsii]TXE04885.1 histidine phosphatase family protein [Subsaximicrobium wynnwilliamsii]
MKKIILVRHGKSSWEHDVTDKERPLKKRGITDAHLVSEAFLTKKVSLDAIYSSAANRAFSTCEIFVKVFNREVASVTVLDKLYDFEGQIVIDFMKSLDDRYNNVMIFGHNNAFTSICNIFGDVYIDNLPTSGLVAIDFDVNSWVDIKKGKTSLTIFPRDFK